MATEELANTVQKIGRYRVIGKLGRGGMGIVYRAEDELIGRQVAIKTLTEVTPELRARFSIEARSGILSHPNIVTVYELGEHEGNPFIAMEFIEGESLEQILQKRKRLPLLEAIAIVKQLCAGLGYAHSHGVVHRDIKPANILVRPDGRATIVDFGIARLSDQTRQLTKADTLLGTFHYMAPERLKGEASDGRSDIWSIGVMLYEMLTGELPFKGSDVSSLYRVIHEPYIPLLEYVKDFPGELGHVLDKALAKQAEDRYATTEEMSFDLQVLSKGLKQDQIATPLAPASTRHPTEGHNKFDSAHTVLLNTSRAEPRGTRTKTQQEEIKSFEGSSLDDDKTRVLTTLPDKGESPGPPDREEAKKREAEVQQVVRRAVLEAQELLLDHPEQALQVLEAALKRVPDSNTLAQSKVKLLEHLKEREKNMTRAFDMEATQVVSQTAQFKRIMEELKPFEHGDESATPWGQVQNSNNDVNQGVSLTSQLTVALPQLEPDSVTSLLKNPEQLKEPASEKSTQEKDAAAESKSLQVEEIYAAIKKAIAICEKAIDVGELDRCLRPFDDVVKRYGTSAELENAREECEAKRSSKVKRVLDEATQTCLQLLRDGAPKQAEKALEKVKYALPFVNPSIRDEWERLKSECRLASSVGSRASSKKKNGLWYISGSIAALAILATVGFFYVQHMRTAEQKPLSIVKESQSPELVLPAPVIAQTVLEINASPWANVLQIEGENGNNIALPDDPTTPLLLDGIKPGTYKVTFAGADGQKKTTECNVSLEKHECVADMGTFDAKQILMGEQP
jgi:serine/threonine protein kinase